MSSSVKELDNVSPSAIGVFGVLLVFVSRSSVTERRRPSRRENIHAH